MIGKPRYTTQLTLVGRPSMIICNSVGRPLVHSTDWPTDRSRLETGLSQQCRKYRLIDSIKISFQLIFARIAGKEDKASRVPSLVHPFVRSHLQREREKGRDNYNNKRNVTSSGALSHSAGRWICIFGRRHLRSFFHTPPCGPGPDRLLKEND